MGVAADAYLTSLDRVELTLFRRVSGRSPSIGARTLLLPDDRALVDRARAAAVATLLPARRAAYVDPAITLRHD